MTAKDFLDELLLQGVHLFSDGQGNLKYRGEKEYLTPQVLTKLKNLKAEILEILDAEGGEINSFPLSHSQKSRWLSSQLCPEDPAFNIMTVLKLSGKLDRAALQRAANRLVERHDILRTTFTLVNDELRQVIHDDMEPVFRFSNMEIGNETDPKLQLKQWTEQESDATFDLSKGPLVRFSLLKSPDVEDKDASPSTVHYLLFVVHHITTDEVSYIQLIQELLALYQSETGVLENIPECGKKRYLDYVYWENKRLSGERKQVLEQFWQKQLSGELPVLDLPTDFIRPKTQTYRGATYNSFLNSELSKPLIEYTKAQKITPYIFFLSIFRILLQRYSKQDEILIGLSITSRYLAGFKDVVGDFVNIVPLRSTLDESSKFENLLTNLQETFFAAMEHQEYPFSLIVKQLEQSFDASRSPVYQAVFNWQTISTQGDLISTGGGDTDFQVKILDGSSTGVNGTTHDIVLTIKSDGESFACTWTYNTDLFKPSTIELFDRHFQTLLQNIIYDQNQCVVDYAHLSQDETLQLLDEYNDTEKAYVNDLLIHELFEEQVSLRGEAVALQSDDDSISFSELNAQANKLAHYLLEQGVRADTIVGVCADRSIDMMVGLLAVLKSGACYLAIDPNYPEERIEYILDDSEVEILLTQAELMGDLPVEDRKLCLLDGNIRENFLANYSTENIAKGSINLIDRNLAYIIYTSGTTGQPKGVCLEHRGAVNLAFNQRDLFKISPEDRIVQFASVSFDAATWEWMMALLNGACLHLLPEDTKLNTNKFEQYIESNGISCATLPPAYLDKLDLTKLSSLRTLITAGEALNRALANRITKALPGTALFNAYGPTETTVCASCYHVDANEVERSNNLQHSVPIGKPLNNCQCYVLDENLAPAPLGVSGELYVGGLGLARGYLHQQELSEGKFISNPFSNEKGQRLYKTGDLVRRLPNGNLEFVGRNDSQVKIRGFRIELGEIEGMLVQDPALNNAAVVLHEAENQSQHLVAFAGINKDAAPVCHQINKLIDAHHLNAEELYLLENGMEVCGVNKSNTEYIYDEIFNNNNYLKHGISLNEGDCVFDVGSNVGLFSVYLCSKMEDVKVHAFEPIDEIYAALEKNSKIYGEGKIIANNFGLSDSERETQFNYYPHNAGASGIDIGSEGHEGVVEVVQQHIGNLIGEENGDNPTLSDEQVKHLLDERLKHEKVTVSLLTLSQYITDNDIQNIDLLKIDVERSELDVLAGINPQDWSRIRQVVVEVHDDDGALSKVETLLRQQGFALYIEECQELKGTGLYNVYARKKTDERTGSESALSSVKQDSKNYGPTRVQEEVKRRLKSKMPEYMLPSSIVLLNSFPLNPHGKIDRQALPIEEVGKQLAQRYIAPVTETEVKLAQLWGETLELDKVGQVDNFFELGGHSLLATQLVSRIVDSFNVELAIQDIFAAPVLEDLAKKIDQAEPISKRELIIEASSEQDVIPLSFSQERLWFFSQLDANSRVYNVPLSCRIHGDLDIDALQRSLQEIIRRHEVLRTRFVKVDNVLQQITNEKLEFSLDVEDAVSKDELVVYRQKVLNTHFDLSSGKPILAKLIRLSGQEHFLFLNMHHSVSDGWSLGILLKELATLYQAFSQGKSSPLPDLTLQYKDFAYWQREWFSGQVMEKQLDYWKNQLADIAPLLSLPIDRPRPRFQSFNGATESVCYPKALSEKLVALSRQYDVTLFMLLLAAFKVMLHRYSGQQDVAIGTPIANRRKKELEPIIGFFVNTLVLRSDFSKITRFIDLLEQVKENTLEAYAHQDMPFEKLVEVLQPERNIGHQPLVQVTFALQNMPLESMQLEGLSLEPVAEENSTSAYDLTLALIETEKGLEGSFQYNTDLFDRATVEGLNNSFHELLKDIVSNPQQDIAKLKLLSEAKENAMLDDRSEQTLEYPSNKFIHQLFESHVDQAPDALAVSFESTSGTDTLSYCQLNERANQLAHYLTEQGLSREAIIAVYMDRSPELIITLLSILKAGASYLAIDPGYPQDRVDYMLEDAGVDFIVSCENQYKKLSGSKAKVVVLDSGEFEKKLAEYSRKNLTNIDSNDIESNARLAYIIYTSGTTGKPKGVCLRHQSAVNLALNQKELFSVSASDRILQFASCSFDAATWEWMMALTNGAGLYILPEEYKHNLTRFENYISTQKISCATLPPAYLATLNFSQLSGLRVLITAGEALSADLAQSVSKALPSLSLFNAYGPTEATVCATTYRYNPELVHAHTVPIGRPLHNCDCYVLDEHMSLLPEGVVGELYITGDGLAKGYLNQPEQTLDSFVSNPFVKRVGIGNSDRLYKTGDLVRRLSDGNLEFIGRCDTQLTLRGFRIESAEVENVLRGHPAVVDAVVKLQASDSGSQHLIAYVVGDMQGDERENVESELFEKLKQQLPDYMCPAAITCLEKLPLTANGKVDLKSLPDVDLAKQTKKKYVEPQTDTEEKLADIWSDMLGAVRVGSLDNFFELGGHSLLATQLNSRIIEQFDLEIGIKEIFVAPVLSDLAKRIDQSLAGRTITQTISSIEKAPADSERPLSFSQERLWFMSQLDAKNRMFNVPLACRIEGELDLDILRQSLNVIVQRHEILRTRFVQTKDTLIQVVEDELVVDLDIESPPVGESTSDYCAKILKNTYFNLDDAGLFKARVIKQSARDHVLLFVIHHSISDAWSLNVLLKELGSLYSALTNGDSSPLEPLALQYGDFAYWHRHWFSGDIQQQQLRYWKEQLAGVPPLLALPTDRPRSLSPSQSGAVERIVYPSSLQSQLKSLAVKEDVTLFMLLLAAFNVYLSRYCGQDDIAIASPVAYRRRRELEPLIGFFVNTLVLRSDLSGNPSFQDFLQKTKSMTLEAFAHQDTPFEKLVEALELDRNLNYAPLAQVSFTLDTVVMEDMSLSDLTLKPFELENDTTTYDLTLSLTETENGLEGMVQYGTDLFDASTIKRFVDNFQALLEDIVAAPGKSISSLECLSENERLLQLHEWNKSERDYPEDKLIHEIFESQVESNPDAIAIDYDGQQITYSVLNECANQVAHYLMEQGIKPDSIVGVYSSRCADMMVGLLAILKVGAGYLAIDPEYPEDRIEYIVEDAGIEYLLTQRDLLAEIPVEDVKLFLLDENIRQQFVGNYSKSNISTSALNITPDNIGYVIYTSGTTGKPRGVCLRHFGAVNLAHAQIETFEITAQDRIVQFASISFDAATWEWMMALLSGARLCILPQEDKLNTLAFEEFIASKKITCATLPPAYVKMLSLEKLSQLRLLVTAGESLSPSLAREIKQSLPRLELYNAYGPSETTVCASVHKVENTDLYSIPIGKPLYNCQCYIMDEHLSLLPVGAIGELYVGGRGLARGYLNQAQLNKTKFISHPFSKDVNDTLYKTGDMVRRLENGDIEFIGRNDNQVKIRGIRIELGEVESNITQNETVNDAVVVVAEDENDDQQLLAYIVTGLDAEDREEQENALRLELQQELNNRLPNYMQPAFYIFLDSLPLTVNGKVDYRALPAPDRTAQQANYIAPETPSEICLASIWSEVLNVKQVGCEDNFFDLGGHSLLAAKVLIRIHEQLSPVIQMEELFKFQSLRELASYIDSLDHNSEAISQQNKVKIEHSGKLVGPVSYGQQRLLLVNKMAEEAHGYNVPIRFSLNGALDLPLFLESIRHLVNRHGSLRSSFEDCPEYGFRQCLHENVDYPVNVVDLSDASAPADLLNNEAAVTRLLDEDMSKLFDLSEAPLFRVSIVKYSHEHHIVAFTLHHIITDGWSLGIFINELMNIYKGFKKGQENPLEPLPIQYIDYSIWQRNYLNEDALTKRLDYWQDKLMHFHERPLIKPDTPNVKERKLLAKAISFSLEKEESQRLIEIARESNATLYSVLLAAFKVLLHSYCGEEDVIVGSASANRNNVDTEGLIGFFVNTTVIRTQFDNAKTFDDILQKVVDFSMESYPYQDLPFENLVEAVAPKRTKNKNPIFQIMFSMENIAQPEMDFGGLSLSAVPLEAVHARFDLEMHIQEWNGKVVGEFAYDTDLFKESTIQRYIKAYTSLLKMIAEKNKKVNLRELNFAILAGDKPTKLKFQK